MDPSEFENVSNDNFVKLLKQCEESLDNIDLFVESVNNQLTEYEMSNIFLLKTLGEKYREIDTNLSECINTVEQYEREISIYEKSVINVLSNFDEIQVFSDWENKHKNKIALYEELTKIIDRLDIDPSKMKNFFESDQLVCPEEICDYVQKLVNSCRGTLSPEIAKLTFVKQQMKTLETLSFTFSEKFVKYIQSIITKKLTACENQDKIQAIHNHTKIFSEINEYAPIMKQIKILNSVGFSEIYTYYCQSFNQHLSKEWQAYFDNIINSIPIYEPTDVLTNVPGAILQRDLVELNKHSTIFSKVFNEYLKQIENAIKEASHYGGRFFGFNYQDTADDANKAALVKDSSTSGEVKFKGADLKVRGMVQSMFTFLESSTLSFLEECIKKEPYYAIPASNIIAAIQLSSSPSDFYSMYISNLVAKSKIISSTIFSMVENVLNDDKSFRKQKANSANCVSVFEIFMNTCESLSNDCQTRNPHLITSYQSLIQKVINVAEHACLGQESKLSREIYLIESLYNLHACLSNLQIKELVEDRKKLRAQYQNAINFFVLSILIKPFGKLSALIEEIDRMNASNVPVNDIEVWVINSKVEFKKSLKDCTFKEIKKNVKIIYDRVNKYFHDSALFSVVWKSILEEILSQFKRIEIHIKEYCVRLPEVRLDFTTDDISQFLKTMNG